MFQCEICNQNLQDLKLDSQNFLDQCLVCHHLQRDLNRCFANARKHAWGGVVRLDYIRIWFTWRAVKKHLKKRKAAIKEAFEIGFGVGFLLEKMMEQNFKMHGCEAEMLDIPILQKIKKKFVYYPASFEDVNLNEKKVDFFYGIHVIEHLADIQKSFKFMYHHLNPKGTIFFITPNGSSLGLKWFKAAWWNLEDPTHVRFFTPNSIKTLLKQTGFQQVEIKIPWWDSFLVEASSVLRMFSKKSQVGALQRLSGKLLILFLFPIFLVLRFCIPKLRSSMVVVAHK